jgi:hypothetical protein
VCHKKIEEDDQGRQGADHNNVKLLPATDKWGQPVSRVIFLDIHGLGGLGGASKIGVKAAVAKLERFFSSFSVKYLIDWCGSCWNEPRQDTTG